jgi:hypothetical protein
MLTLVIDNTKTISTAAPPAHDLEFRDEGSVWLMRPTTKHGSAWVAGNVSHEEWQRIGDSVAIDFRYVDCLIDLAVNDGMACQVPDIRKLPSVGRRTGFTGLFDDYPEV